MSSTACRLLFACFVLSLAVCYSLLLEMLFAQHERHHVARRQLMTTWPHDATLVMGATTGGPSPVTALFPCFCLAFWQFCVCVCATTKYGAGSSNALWHGRAHLKKVSDCNQLQQTRVKRKKRHHKQQCVIWRLHMGEGNCAWISALLIICFRFGHARRALN